MFRVGIIAITRPTYIPGYQEVSLSWIRAVVAKYLGITVFCRGRSNTGHEVDSSPIVFLLRDARDTGAREHTLRSHAARVAQNEDDWGRVRVTRSKRVHLGYVKNTKRIGRVGLGKSRQPESS